MPSSDFRPRRPRSASTTTPPTRRPSAYGRRPRGTSAWSWWTSSPRDEHLSICVRLVRRVTEGDKDSALEEADVRFISMVKAAESGPPSPELMGAIGKLAQELGQSGVLMEMGGLLPSAKGARMRLSR